MAKDLGRARLEMAEAQIVGRGIIDRNVIRVMKTVPRERFVPQHSLDEAYADRPLDIGWGQTISQPFVVALMIEVLALGPDDRVLDIGTGSGYAAAVLSRIVAEVVSVERIPELAAMARSALGSLGYDNVRVITGDGTLGWEEGAPYDGILVSAGTLAVPEALKRQLAPGGRLVIPVGGEYAHQRLIRLTRTGEDSYEEEGQGMVRFVPLVSDHGGGSPRSGR